MKRKSIRATLSLYLLLGTAALLLVAGLALDYMVRSWLEAEFDRGLEAKAAGFISLTEQDGDQVELDFAPEFMPEFGDEEDPEYFQMWVGDEIFRGSESLRGYELQRDEIRSISPRLVDVVLPDGRDGRQIQMDFVPRFGHGDEEIPGADLGDTAETGDVDVTDEEQADQGEAEDDEELVGLDPSALPAGSGRVVATMVIARGREHLDDAITSFGIALGGVSVVLMIAIALLIRFVVPSGLEPLNEVGRQVERLHAGSLSTRIGTSNETEEIAPLVGTLNHLLDRLEKAFERERRFSSDVAHELRTPVAELKSLAEVGSRWPDDREAVRRFFEDVHDISGTMERTIGNLLSLARCDAGIEEVVIDEVRLATTVDRLCRLLSREAEQRNVRFAREVPTGFVIQTDASKFELILLNLLSNAVAYSRRGGTVTCLASNGSDRVTVSISNPVQDLTENDLPLMFDRFWRKDSARTAGDHSGLGLSLVRALADLLSIELDVALEDRGGDRLFRVSLSAPVQSAAS